MSGLKTSIWRSRGRAPSCGVSRDRPTTPWVAGLISVLLFVSGCSTQKAGQGSVPRQPASDSSQVIVNVPTSLKDSGPIDDMDASHIPDAVPRRELRTIAGNKSPYEVLGITYRVMDREHGFSEEGLASWYGNKFHGKRTANGELYSMYAMSGAHKTLPIPSYARVTNLDNGRQVVVRINDRGPFHHGRVIDLSYAAASKLGYARMGTARVRVEAVLPQEDMVSKPAASRTAEALAATQSKAGQPLPNNAFLQAGAFSTPAAAEQLRQRLGQLTSLPIRVVPPKTDKLYRVHVGPIQDNLKLAELRTTLQDNQLPATYLVYD